MVDRLERSYGFDSMTSVALTTAVTESLFFRPSSSALRRATLSYVGLGFSDAVPTWGTMLHDASNVALVGEAPWMLARAAAIFLVVLAVNLVVQGSGRNPVQFEP